MRRVSIRWRGNAAIRMAGVLLVALVAWACVPAWANPLPPAAVFTHVQPHVPDFCATTTITACEQIVQSTGAEGSVDFGLFFQPTMSDPTPLAGIDLVVEWPSQWGFVGVEFCGGVGAVVQNGNRAELTIQLDPGYTMADFFAIASVTLDAPVAGRLEIPEGHYVVAGGVPDFLMGFPAWAAMGCRTCFYACDFSDVCTAGTDVDRIELQAAVGGIALGGFRGWASGMNPLCDVHFGTSAPWLEIEVMPSGLGGYDVTLVADAAGLAPGTYETWVDAVTPTCQGCVQVIFTVTGCSPAQDASWGAVKRIFR